MAALTNGQEIAMSLLFLLSSTLSILGSSTIIYKVLLDLRNTSSYDRLMLGLSTCDIIASLGWLLTPFLLPKETSTRPWAIGNEATCTFLGFMTQLGFSAVVYNMCLSFYYLLTVRYGVNRLDFAAKYEIWIHGIPIAFGTITSTVGAVLGVFSEVDVGFGCWVNNYPRGCIDDACFSTELGWLFGAGPIIATLLSLLVNNVLVYMHVRKAFQMTPAVDNDRALRQRLQKQEVAHQGLWYVASFVFCYWAAAVGRGLEAFSTAEAGAIEGGIYWVLVIQAATLPFQGFLNMFVYNRPNYSRLRAAYPDLSVLVAVRKACFDRKIPRLQEITWSNSPHQSYNQYRDRSSSGAAFQSGLPSIREEEGDDGSVDDGDFHLGPRTGSMIAIRGDTNEDFDVDGTSGSRGSFSSITRGDGMAETSVATVADMHCQSAAEEPVDKDLARPKTSNGAEQLVTPESQTAIAAANPTNPKRISMDGRIDDTDGEGN